MNITLIFDECYIIEIFNETFTKYGFPKPGQKTITVGHAFKAKINVQDIRVSPKTYWNIGNYDAQFEGRDANCWLCNWYGMDYDKCKCKENFTLEEHKENLKIARRNYLTTLFKNYFPKYSKFVKEFSDEVINDLLFDDSNGVRRLKLNFPHWSRSAIEIKEMQLYLDAKLKHYNK